MNHRAQVRVKARGPIPPRNMHEDRVKRGASAYPNPSREDR
jgi:hypothetical protein